MDRRLFTLSSLSAAVVALTGCGGGDGDAPIAHAPPPAAPGPTPELASATSLVAGTTFMQTRVAVHGRERAPGQANYWDINANFSLSDGGRDQWDDALELSVTPAGGERESFPNQAYAEVTAFGPEIGAADGLKVVTFQSNAAYLHPIRGAKLQQTLDLTTAKTPIALSWEHGELPVGTSQFDDEPYAFQVVIRSTAGALLKTIYRYASDVSSGSESTGDLSEFAGERLVLSFELDQPSPNVVIISSVSVTDDESTQFVNNGTFDNAAGWVVPEVKVSQNILSGQHTVGGVQVRRMFYTQPNVIWGRFADTFTNPGSTPITITVRYDSDLGSDDYGIIYDTPGANGRAITTWDGDGSDRDTGIVFGSGATVNYTSDTGLEDGYGSEDIDHSYSLTIPAGATRTLINFILMSGVRTYNVANDISARATEIDTAAADIANNFRTNLAYQRGLAQVHLDTLQNF